MIGADDMTGATTGGVNVCVGINKPGTVSAGAVGNIYKLFGKRLLKTRKTWFNQEKAPFHAISLL